MSIRSRKVTLIVILIMMGTLMSSCNATSDPQSLLSGTLVWTPGNNFIYQWNGVTDKKSTLLKLPYGTSITGLAKVSSAKLIFSTEIEVTDDRPVTELSDRMYLLDMVTKEVIFLHDGFAPTYLAARHKLFFLGKSGGLYVADFNGTDSITGVKEIHQPGVVSVGAGAAVVPVSHKNVIFDYDSINDSGENAVLKYDVAAGKWDVLPLENCRPVLWRSATQQLLCTKGDSFNYFLTSLKGSDVEDLGRMHPISFFLYLHGLDAALAIRPGSFFPPEREDIWIYFFKTGKWKRLIKDAGATSGSAVWITNN